MTVSSIPRVLLTLPMHPAAEEKLAEFAEILRPPDCQPATLQMWALNADAIIVRAQLPDSIFATSPRLRAAVRHGAGLDMIPIDQATAHGVPVANVPGVNARTVAEYVVWALLSARRRLLHVSNARRLEHAQPWQWSRQFADAGLEIDGARIGIVGFGNVGQSIASMLKALWQVDILAYNRSVITPTDGVRQCELDELLSQSDAVVLAIPLTEKTRHLISAERLATMKVGSVLINVARGPIVDETALLAALEANRPAVAVLDVFDQQPLPKEHPFWTHEKILMTPHVAGISEGSMRRMGLGAVEEVHRILDGHQPLNFVNPEVWPNRRAI